jgi:16S rRNA (guanine966-N2)-methyltransferase
LTFACIPISIPQSFSVPRKPRTSRSANKAHQAPTASTQKHDARNREGGGSELGDAPPGSLRIIGGLHRGRKLRFSGDPRTRPMKDRVREAVFNLLGNDVKGSHVLDLFAGTGALGLEALSRGAARATFYEQHFPTAAIIRENAATIGFQDRSEVIAANTFIQFRRIKPPQVENTPWLVFCSPPYDFYIDRTDETLKLLNTILTAAIPHSVLVVEADARFDFGLLPQPENWEIREYPPALVGILRLPAV